ncbi:DUF2147 domain-containing protein [Acinetobacter sp. ANC 3832]|uniref:DUF2147 domain-containing protein n=1 Tax=Acinetobacter sp. ANC 3832 TaxID=1977874 RepID=UPI000A333FDE|nr:DUF2147 domain-containing protein [Acinetobacter sp. ANC 3832]OTG89886.1 signal peptidase [Acinetobacter sp. ANC 3832]
MKRFRIFIGAMALSVVSSMLYAQDITGTWRYIDDKTGEPKGLVKIEQQPDGSFAGKVLRITPRPGYTPKEICTGCPAPYTNKQILGMQVITGLKTEDQTSYTDGRILDPVAGKIYRLKGKLSPNGKKLYFRGYVGVSAMGRSQTWLRVE